MANPCEILKRSKTVCVVGISDKPGRDSGRIANFLVSKGFEVTGVHPTLSQFEGIPVYKSIADVPGNIDIVDVFLSSDKIPQIIDDVLKKMPGTLWLQLGVENDEAVKPVKEIGIEVIQNKCVAIEYRFC